ncbi:MAG: UpxY family transcription antiterminator [Muribaculaceae bacterium]|nr:UpxY family transcription antiterminator [Muribaculaceae bacterium]
METVSESQQQWFVMRDLKRPNAKLPAYKQLGEMGFEVFTPLTSKIMTNGSKRVRIQVPVIQDLLFVHSDKDKLDKIVAKTATLQYRFVKGAPYCTPMTVPTNDMNRFMAAVEYTKTPKFYTPDEITPNMYGATVRMVCDGSINGLEGRLLKIRGSAKKRFLIELPGLLAASIEVESPDYVEIVND